MSGARRVDHGGPQRSSENASTLPSALQQQHAHAFRDAYKLMMSRKHESSVGNVAIDQARHLRRSYTIRVPTFGDKNYDGLFHSSVIPGSVHFFNAENKVWIFTAAFVHLIRNIVYRNENNSVQFTVTLPQRLKPQSYTTISLDTLYYHTPRRPGVDIPSRALIHALRKLASVVEVTDVSTYSHSHPLPRFFLRNDFNLYAGAEPNYDSIDRIRPQRRLMRLLTSGKKVTPQAVMKQLRDVPVSEASKKKKFAHSVASISSNGHVLQPEVIHNLLEAMNKSLLRTALVNREFSRRTPL